MGVFKSRSDRFIHIGVAEHRVQRTVGCADAERPGAPVLGARSRASATTSTRPRTSAATGSSAPTGRPAISAWCARRWRGSPTAARGATWSPHRDDAFVQDFAVFRDFLAVNERCRRPAPRAHRCAGPMARRSVIESGEKPYTAYLGSNPETGHRHAALRLHLADHARQHLRPRRRQRGQRTLLKRDPVLGGFDPANYASEYVFATARDGTRVPVSMVYRKRLRARRHGRRCTCTATAPTARPRTRRSPASVCPLLDRGFVYAIAHIRGGQEMGRQWYDDGKLLQEEEHLHRLHRRRRVPGARRLCGDRTGCSRWAAAPAAC